MAQLSEILARWPTLFAIECATTSETETDVTKTAECWCGQTHPEQTDSLTVAVETVWHLLVAKMRAPQIVAWLNRQLARGRGRS